MSFFRFPCGRRVFLWHDKQIIVGVRPAPHSPLTTDDQIRTSVYVICISGPPLISRYLVVITVNHRPTSGRSHPVFFAIRLPVPYLCPRRSTIHHRHFARLTKRRRSIIHKSAHYVASRPWAVSAENVAAWVVMATRRGRAKGLVRHTQLSYTYPTLAEPHISNTSFISLKMTWGGLELVTTGTLHTSVVTKTHAKGACIISSWRSGILYYLILVFTNTRSDRENNCHGHRLRLLTATTN